MRAQPASQKWAGDLSGLSHVGDAPAPPFWDTWLKVDATSLSRPLDVGPVTVALP